MGFGSDSPDTLPTRGLFLLFCLALLGGCATQPPLPSVSQFQPLSRDARVLYEPGGEMFAERVAAALPQALQQVEATHARPFSGPITIYVCATATCFERYVPTPRLSGATMRGDRVFLAPQLNAAEAPRLQPLLTHELSHLHLSQLLGHYTPDIPIWFHEGLAALAAQGGGAEYASDGQAIEAIRRGKMFAPEQMDQPGKRHTAPAWGLDIHTFYRQSLLFVRYLRDQSQARFAEFLEDVLEQQDFALAFGNAYNMTLQQAGEHFRQTLNTTPITANLSE